MDLTSRVVEAADLEAAAELCYANKWTDGLPVVPPTRGAIDAARALGMPQLDIYVYPQHKPGDYEAEELPKGVRAAQELPGILTRT